MNGRKIVPRWRRQSSSTGPRGTPGPVWRKGLTVFTSRTSRSANIHGSAAIGSIGSLRSMPISRCWKNAFRHQPRRSAIQRSRPQLRRQLAVHSVLPPRSAIACQPASGARSRWRSNSLVRRSLLARLHFRHVNQAERWQSTVMDRKGAAYVAAIPGTYTDSPYPLQYYFELKSAPDRAWLHPGFPKDLAGQPYYVVRS